MMRKSVVALATLLAGFGPCASARAADPGVPGRGQLTVNVGTGASTGHLQESGVVSAPPLLYGGLELQLQVHAPFGIGVLAGGTDVTGWFFGANARVEGHGSPRVFLSAGVGPLVVASGGLAGLLMVEGDATLSVRFTTNAALTIGPMLAVAANHRGTPACGADTCNAWAGPGDRLLLLRVGVGAAF